ncbi:MAG TPA: MFS transporter [Verrucomicrobiae bacterium]|nr:MFS transporter [Verrucomicrobiae bacterium]
MKVSRDYLLLLAGQFLGAFGDNFLLAAILGPLTFQLGAGQITEQGVNAQNALFSAVFFVPFIVLAPLVGFLNDRMPKTSWLFGGNALKLLGTAVGFAGVWLHAGAFHPSRGWQVVGYAIVGIGACAYSPAKYGVLPEIVPSERLVKANGTVEMLTLVAILGGLWGGATLYDHVRSLPLCYLASAGLYAAALIFNAAMSRTPHNPAATLSHSIGEFGSSLRSLITHRRLGRVLLGCGIFWFAGATVRSNLQGWGLEVFHQAGMTDVNNQELAWLKVGMIMGIVAGAVLAGQLHRVGDLSWTRRYGMLLAVFIFLLGAIGGHWGLPAVVIALIFAGAVSGLLIVPLNAALQDESDHTKLGKTIAIQNFIDYLSMLAGAGFLAVLTAFGLTPTGIFVALPVALVLLSLALAMPRPKPSANSR